MTQNTKNSPVSLSMMMFLQYAVWGVWLPYLANYLTGAIADGGLGFSGAQVGWILGLAGSIGAVSAPFLAGQIADRFIDASKYLGILLILGGIAKFATFYATSYNSFLVMSIIFSVMYMPTLALTNSIAFERSRRKFPAGPRLGNCWLDCCINGVPADLVTDRYNNDVGSLVLRRHAKRGRHWFNCNMFAGFWCD